MTAHAPIADPRLRRKPIARRLLRDLRVLAPLGALLATVLIAATTVAALESGARSLPAVASGPAPQR